MSELSQLEKFDSETEVTIESRLTRYDVSRLCRGDKPNPRYSEARLHEMAELKRLRGEFHWSDVTAMIAIAPAMMCAIASVMVFMPGVDQTRALLTVVLGLSFAIAGWTPAYLRWKPGGLQLESGAPLKISMGGSIGAAWDDWRGALATCKKLAPHGDAYEALLRQDAILRPALVAYLQEVDDLEREQRDEFEKWFFRTCAEGFAVAEAEKVLHELALVAPEVAALASPPVLPAAIELAISSPRELSEPLRNASILRDAVADALARGAADRVSLPDPK